MMREDLEFNIEFCELIEQYPDLYDYTKSGYSNRNVQDKLWREIGVKIGATAKDCKERWKNIRGSYSKSKRNMTAPSGSAVKTTKEYYLASNLRFLDIFLKSRPPKGNLENNPDHTIDDESTSMSAGSSASELPATDFIAPQQTPPPSKGKQVNISDVNKSAYEYFSLKNKQISTRHQNMYEEGKGKNVNDDSEADMAFFRSMLPDVTLMTQDQKRKFKFGVLNLIERILKEPNTSHTPYSRSVSPYQRYSSRESEYNSPLHVRSYESPSPRHINTTGAYEHPELQQTQPAPQQTQTGAYEHPVLQQTQLAPRQTQTGAYEHPVLQQTQPAPRQTQSGAYEHPVLQQTQPAPQQTQTGAYEHPVLQQTQLAPRQTQTGAYEHPVLQQTQPAPQQTQSGAYEHPVLQQTQPAPQQTQTGAYGYPVFQPTQPAPQQTQSGAYGYPVFQQTQTDAHEQPVLQQTLTLTPQRARAQIYLPMFSPVTPVSPPLQQIIEDGQPQDEVNNFNT